MRESHLGYSQAFGHCLTRHQRLLRVLARKLCRHAVVDPEDLVQDTLERALRQAEWLQSQGESTVRAWLCTTLRRRFIDCCRHRQVERADAPELKRVRAPVLVREERSWQAWEHVSEEALSQAIARLTPRLRAAYELHATGLRYEAIAQHLGVTPSTVGAWLCQARRALREQLLQPAQAGEASLAGLSPRAQARYSNGSIRSPPTSQS